MTRVFLAASLEDLQTLASGARVRVMAYAVTPGESAVAVDEEAEFAALHCAAAQNPCTLVIAADAELADPQSVGMDLVASEATVSLEQVAAFHVDVDDDGDLAWFATQEIDMVLGLLSSTAPEGG